MTACTYCNKRIETTIVVALHECRRLAGDNSSGKWDDNSVIVRLSEGICPD